MDRQRFYILLIGMVAMTTGGCSVFGNSGVEIAPYEMIQSDGEIEIRYYDSLVLVSTPMTGDGQESKGAFRRLFDYISGANTTESKMEMTAPVVTESDSEKGQEIAMTAPVFMGEEAGSRVRMMSFVLPREMTPETAPKPTDPKVFISKTGEMTVAAIRFSGLLGNQNVQKNQEKLEQWIMEKGYTVTGDPKTAGYNPPWTLPNLRRNEILIPINY